ncbi:MAG: hypothetical protein JNM77_08855 [Pseudonocardia sp.]|nr:hypothetical protein [Pseudonocardia sp.]
MITQQDAEAIDQWVAEQMAEPWPLSVAQLGLIRRTYGQTRTPHDPASAAGSALTDAA